MIPGCMEGYIIKLTEPAYNKLSCRLCLQEGLMLPLQPLQPQPQILYSLSSHSHRSMFGF